jgi:hypothetical protein
MMNKNHEPNDGLDFEADNRIYSPNTLKRIASWAYILSWASLILSVALFIGRLISLFQGGLDFQTPMNSVLNLVGFLSSLVVGISWFVVLQAISEGVYLLIDIGENKRIDR